MSDPITNNAPPIEQPQQAPEEEPAPITPRHVECRNCDHWNQMKEKVRIAELLQTAINKLEQRFNEKEFKPTVAEYLKLIQLEKELDQEQVKEIKVTWVKTEPSNDE